MRRWQRTASIGAMLLATTALTAMAQEETAPPAPALVTLRPGVEVAADEPLALYVQETIVNPRGQFATVIVWVQEADEGFIQLTPCDDMIVRCEEVHMRIEGVAQGEVFTLGGE